MLVALALSFLVGVSLGLFGGGGSILTVPILVYVLGVEPKGAIATSLLVVGVTSAAAIVPHAREGRVRWRTGAVFGASGMVGAFAAGLVADAIPGGLLLLLFAITMLVTAAAMMRGRRTPERAHADATPPAELPLLRVVSEGLVVGAVTGLVGAGGGFLVVPALVLHGGLPMSAAVGTSLLVIAMKSFAGLAGYLGHVAIDLPLALLVTGSAVVGSVAGSALAGRVEPDSLRRGFAWFVVAMGAFMLAREVPAALGAEVDWAKLARAGLPYAIVAATSALVAYRVGRHVGLRAGEKAKRSFQATLRR